MLCIVSLIIPKSAVCTLEDECWLAAKITLFAYGIPSSFKGIFSAVWSNHLIMLLSEVGIFTSARMFDAGSENHPTVLWYMLSFTWENGVVILDGISSQMLCVLQYQVWNYAARRHWWTVVMTLISLQQASCNRRQTQALPQALRTSTWQWRRWRRWQLPPATPLWYTACCIDCRGFLISRIIPLFCESSPQITCSSWYLMLFVCYNL